MSGFLRLVNSFGNAFRGLWYILKQEQNFRIELFAALVIIVAMILLPVKIWEAVALIFCIFAVLVMEIVNTLIERLVNILRPRLHPYIGMIKDITAGMVFLTSLGATIVGLIIFGSRLFK